MKKAYDGCDIIAKYLRLPLESPIPKEGNFELFYEAFIDRDTAILLSVKDEYHVFYFTSYDIVEEVRNDEPAVIFEPFENAVKCVIIFNPEENQVTAVIALDLKEKEHRDFLQKTQKTYTFQFHFVSMFYGELHKMRSLLITIPETAFDSISDLLK